MSSDNPSYIHISHWLSGRYVVEYLEWNNDGGYQVTRSHDCGQDKTIADQVADKWAKEEGVEIR